MSDVLNKIKARIKALSDKTVQNGCSEAEAISAMQKVGDLLSQYNLTMSEIELKGEKTFQKKFIFSTKVQYVNGGLLATIAKFCSVKVWYAPIATYAGTRTKTGKRRVKNIVDGCYFFGFDQDIQMAEYLYNTLNGAIYSEIQKYKLSYAYINATIARKSMTTSFEHGMGVRLIQRLNELCDQMNKTSAASTNNALVVVKNQMVENDFNKLKLKLKESKSSYRVRDGGSYGAGHKAGDNVNLSRPVTGDKSEALRLSFHH